jgi:hypothetical protein
LDCWDEVQFIIKFRGGRSLTSALGPMTYDSDISPVGWYVATYQLRFVELAQAGNEDLERRFLTWENTILVKASQIDVAYDKAVEFGLANTQPYKGTTRSRALPCQLT